MIFPRLMFSLFLMSTSLCATDYLSIKADIPLAPGLERQDGSAMSFDSVDGRIAQESAYGENLSACEIHEFYEKTLPGLGWQRIDRADGFAFERDGDHLEISTAVNPVDNVNQVIVGFSISQTP